MPRKEYWDGVYTTKANDEVSWFEAESMESTLGDRFSLIESQHFLHTTPWGKQQRFFFGGLSAGLNPKQFV